MIECTRRDQAFHDAAVDLFRVDPQAEVLDAGKRHIAAHFGDVIDRRLSDALDGGQRVIDPVVAGLEMPERGLHRRRNDRDAEAAGILTEVVQLLAVRHIVSHRRGEELDRIMRLHESGLVGDDGVGRGV
jgi:hypothetical protein